MTSSNLARAPGLEALWKGGRYRPLGLLGRGSFGDVHLVRDELRSCPVALKVLRRWEPAALTDLRREFRALKDVSHPNLVELFELHVDDSIGFFTMEALDGAELTAYVAAGADASERMVRARRCLLQLYEAVSTLHRCGTLHRDLKPSNVMVTTGERLVVLDAGLAKSIDAQRSSQQYLTGTPRYMSPEQAFGGRLTPASDWYSFGVIAHELFAGHIPFETSPLGALQARLTMDVPPLASSDPEVPLEDARMVDRLLAREPRDRPGADEIGAWLESARVENPGWASAAYREAPRGRRTLVGREAELSKLDSALEHARTGSVATVFISAESGLGKSVLVEEWLAKRQSDLGLLILRGRSYERETIPFSCFDDIFDLVARNARPEFRGSSLAPEERVSLEDALGRRGHGLNDAPTVRADAELVNRTTSPEASAPEGAVPPDPAERQRLLGRALSRVLVQVAGTQTAVIWLDDLQWAGRDTARLVIELSRVEWPRGALFILTHRPPGDEDRGCVRQLSTAIPALHGIALQPLSSEEAVRLVETLVPECGGEVTKLVTQAGGHPLLLEQAARVIGRARAYSLHEVLAFLIEGLSAPARALLEVLAVAQHPIPEGTALAAAGDVVGRDASRVLLGEGLARRAGRFGHALVIFHDRIREVVLAELDPGRVRSINLAVATALDRNGQGEPEVLVSYFLAAGERRRAADYISLATRHLEAALAFERAASLYRMRLEIADEMGSSESASIRLALADALVNSGRTEEGARERLAVASSLAPVQRERQYARAARELIRVGRVDEGVELARTTLAQHGLGLSSSRLRTIASILVSRALLRVRGLKYQLHAATNVPSELLEQVDWCQSVAVVLPVIDTLRGFQVHTQGLRWALEAGEPGRLSAALAMEAGYRMALSGGIDVNGRAANLLGTARMLGEASRNPLARGLVATVGGSICWSAGDWMGCISQIEEAVRIFRSECVGASWEVNLALTHGFDALRWRGEMRRVGKMVREELERAEAQGDLYASTMYVLRDLPAQYLVEDRPDDARECSAARERWGNRGFQVEHMADLFRQTEVDLYLGRGADAFMRTDGQWRELVRGQFMRLQPFRVELRTLRARAALAAAFELPPGKARRRLEKLVEGIVRALAREAPSVRGTVFGAPVAAALARLRGDDDGARAHLDRGIDAAQAAGMGMHEMVMRYARACLTGDRVEREVTKAWMSSEGVVRPERYLQVIAPGGW